MHARTVHAARAPRQRGIMSGERSTSFRASLFFKVEVEIEVEVEVEIDDGEGACFFDRRGGFPLADFLLQSTSEMEFSGKLAYQAVNGESKSRKGESLVL